MKNINPILLTLLMLLVLPGCSDSSKLEGLIAGQLNDPDSARFKEVVYGPSEKRACLPWNAKNRLGGYGGWEYAYFYKFREWELQEVQGEPKYCSFMGLNLKELLYEESIAIMIDFPKLLAKGKNISIDEATALRYSDFKCRSLYTLYEDASLEFIEALHNGKEPSDYSKRRISSTLEKLSKGDCS